MIVESGEDSAGSFRYALDETRDITEWDLMEGLGQDTRERRCCGRDSDCLNVITERYCYSNTDRSIGSD